VALLLIQEKALSNVSRLTSSRSLHDREETIISVDRAFRVVELLADAREGMGLSDVARALDVNKAIASKLLNTLEALGYIWREEAPPHYHLTYRVSNLSLRQLQTSGLIGQCSAVLEKVADRTKELVRLAIVEAGERITWVYAVVGMQRSLRIDPSFNFEVSLHSHATGKAWLMALPWERARALVERDGLRKLTAHTTIDLEALRREIEESTRRGFAVTYEENEIGVGAVAAPIVAARLSGLRECVGAVSIAAPTNRMTRADIEACGPLAAEAAAHLAAMWPLDERVGVRQRPQI
jgi:DNA-binding IclR family transcriptional regulator